MRNITKDIFFNIFDGNTSLERLEFKNTSVVRISAYEAFIYANITGAGYLDNLVMPFTPKGLMKIFQAEDNLKLVTGLWDRFRPYYTPRNIAKARDYIATGDKYIIPIEFRNELEYNDKIKELFYMQDFPGQFLIQRIEENKKGNGLESLIEYFACEYFKAHGYLVDNQFPLSQAHGSPDWIAMSTDDSEFGRLRKQGFYLFELAMPSFFGHRSTVVNSAKNRLGNSIVGEVKVTASNSTSQLNKYLSTDFFDSGVLCFTDRYLPGKSQASIAYFDEHWRFRFEPEKRLNRNVNVSSFEKYLYFILLNLKIYLLSALSEESILSILSIRNFNEIKSKADFVRQVSELDIERILDIS
jgi:hypothetical protein